VLDAASVAHRLTPGALVFMGPDCAYGWKSSGSGPCRILLWMWSCFSNPALAAEPRSTCRIRLLDRGGRKTFRMLHDLCRGEILRREPSVGYLDGCRMMFEETIRRELPGSGQVSPPASGFQQQADAWMASHLDSREPVARLCDYLDLSQSTLYRRSLAEFGVSPLARFQELRMREAKRLLAGGGTTVKEVAFRLGYSHFNDFSRAYRKHCGRSPSLDR
jgi:AraC family transcriptional regulator of arabinose operon